MWDWATLQSTGQTVWDWGSKMGIGGVAVWLLQRWFSKRDKAGERGQARVDAAQPELVPTGNAGTQYVVQLYIENRGSGTARTRSLGFTAVQEIPTLDEVPVGQARLTAGLNVQGSPLFDPASNGQAEIRLVYVDRYDNEYRLLIPVTRQNRADGGFNMAMDWHHYTNIIPKLPKTRLREIGGA
jgi:hypothetical protein